MNITWPITGLYLPVIGWYLYTSLGRTTSGGHSMSHKDHQKNHSTRQYPSGESNTTTASDHEHTTHHQPHAMGSMSHSQHKAENTHQGDHSHHYDMNHMSHMHGQRHHHGDGEKPLWKSALVDNTHCGGGCTIGDIVTALVSAIVTISIAGSMLLGHFVLDFIGAFVFGIVFQYLPKREMNPSMSRTKALVEALKADTLSVIFYQIGMYIWMLICMYGFHMRLDVFSFSYWFIMQIAMLAGFITVYPANIMLIKLGIKEAM
ncbi:DUF4396 domain-containing protein [Cernens ardua]|uniref:DUF4396 domain-containing protein n=1 Tax=Cernens ardua TaxID=3402176 RepID=UPI003F9553EE